MKLKQVELDLAQPQIQLSRVDDSSSSDLVISVDSPASNLVSDSPSSSDSEAAAEAESCETQCPVVRFLLMMLSPRLSARVQQVDSCGLHSPKPPLLLI